MKYLEFLLILLFLPAILYPREYSFNEVEYIVIQYTANQRYEEALEELYKYKKAKPNDCRVYIEIVKIFKAMNNMYNAKQVYLEGIDDAANCRPILHYKLGVLCYNIGDYQDGIYHLKKFIRLTDEADIISKYKNTYKIMGVSYYLTSKHTNAIKYLKKYLKIDFKNAEVYKYLATSYLKNNDIDYYNSYLKINNLLLDKKNITKDDLLYKMGLIFFKYSKYEDAKENLLKIYEQKRKNYKLNFNLGLTYLFIGEHKNAVDFMEKTIKYYKKRFSLKKIVNKLLHIDKNGAKYHLALSMAYYLNKEENKAIDTFEEIKKYDSSIYKQYKYNFQGAKDSKLYRELKDSWEY